MASKQLTSTTPTERSLTYRVGYAMGFAVTSAAIVTVIAAGVAGVVVGGKYIWKKLKSKSSGQDARAALYSMPAYTQLTLEQAQTIFDSFRLPVARADSSSSTTASASSSPRRFTVIKIKELMGGLANSNYAFEVLDHASQTTSKLLLKIFEDKTYEEAGLHVKAIARIQRVTMKPGAKDHPEFPHPCPISYPYRCGLSAEDPTSIEKSTVESASKEIPIEIDQFMFTCPAISKRPLVFYQYLDGQVIRQASNHIMNEIARGQAQLHAIPTQAASSPGRPTIDSFDFLPSIPFGMFAIQEQYDRQVLGNTDPQYNWREHPFVKFLETQLSDLQTCVQASHELPESIIHSDLFFENMMFTKDTPPRLLGMIDFEEMGRGPRVLDVAMTIVGCCYETDSNKLNVALTRSFLESYQSYAPFTVREKELFPIFLKYALLAIAYWRFQNFNILHTEPNERKEAYYQMQQRVEELDTETMTVTIKSFF